ncbi:MAG: hypothetical protein LRS49_00655 [Desulfurococcales archaeon]|nr:hypothetical protein [Desulfurococcales archaeon]
MRRLHSLAAFLAFFVASMAVMLGFEAAACVASKAGGEGEYHGWVSVRLFSEAPDGLYRLRTLDGAGLLSIKREGEAVEVRLYWLGNGSREAIVAFRLVEGRVYAETPQGPRLVGRGLSPLYAPRPGVLAPLCPRLLGGSYSYLGLRPRGLDVLSETSFSRPGGGTVDVRGPLLEVRGPALASVSIRLDGGAKIRDGIGSLSATYSGGVAAYAVFAVDPEWLPGWVRGAAGGNVSFADVTFSASPGGLPRYLGLPWWPAMIAASTIVGVAGVALLRRGEA